MKVSKNFLPDSNWYNKKINLGDNLNFNQNKDFVVLPEIWAHFAVDLGFIKKSNTQFLYKDFIIWIQQIILKN